jgi:hypothetical protein
LLSDQSVFTVDSTTDTGAGSGNAGDVAYVIGLANQNPNPAGSLIQFSPAVFATPQTISLTRQIDLTETAGPVIIKGPGSSNLTLNGANVVTIGSLFDGVLQVAKGVTASLAGVTISGSQYGGSFAAGGGIANHGSLAIDNCTISDNTLEGTNSQGAGIFNDGTLSITSSAISDNTCLSGDLGAGIDSAGEGAGIYNSGSLTLTGCTMRGNSVLGFGGAIFNSGVLVISASTIAGNSSSVWAGGIWNEGTSTATDTTIADNTAFNSYSLISSGVENDTFGGGAVNDGAMTFLDCTVANNSAFEGAGLYNEGDSLSLVNCTVAFNTAIDAASSSGPIAGSGAGIYAYPSPPPAGITPSAPVVLENTIVAGNLYSGAHGTSTQNLATSPGASFSANSSYNLIGPGNNGTGLLQNGVNRNQVGVANPGLQALGSYGGPTQTIELEYNSPAIDAGSNALDGGQQVDGRGAGYERIAGGTVDIGADEFVYQPAPIVSRFVVVWGSNDASDLESERGGNLLPQGRKNDIPWLGINQFLVQFSQQLVLTSADIRLQSARGIAYGPVTISGFPHLYTITLARPIDKADRVTVLIEIPQSTPFSGTLNVLPGDVNGDGVVNSKDLAAIHKWANVYFGPPAVVYQDITGDGKANGRDYLAVKDRLGTMLPPPLPKAKRLDAVLDRARSHSTTNRS